MAESTLKRTNNEDCEIIPAGSIPRFVENTTWHESPANHPIDVTVVHVHPIADGRGGDSWIFVGQVGRCDHDDCEDEQCTGASVAVPLSSVPALIRALAEARVLAKATVTR